jgi:chromate transporter
MNHNRFMSRLPLSTLTGIFLRIGNTTFGGGDPTITALQRELVERRKAITPEQYGAVYALARVTPGTNMLAFCAGAGWALHGWMGAIFGVGAVTVPSAVIALVLLNVFEILMRNPVAASAIEAMIASAVGLMFAGAWLLVRPYVTRSNLLRTSVLLVAVFLLTWKPVLSPLQALGAAALAGFVWREPR